MHFVMQVRTCTLARTAYFTDNLTSYHPLTELRTETLQVSVPSLITEAVVNDNNIAVTGFPSHFYHLTIASGVYLRPRMSREVHARMKFGSSVDRVDTRAITGSRLTQILIGNRLNGRYTT